MHGAEALGPVDLLGVFAAGTVHDRRRLGGGVVAHLQTKSNQVERNQLNFNGSSRHHIIVVRQCGGGRFHATNNFNFNGGSSSRSRHHMTVVKALWRCTVSASARGAKKHVRVLHFNVVVDSFGYFTAVPACTSNTCSRPQKIPCHVSHPGNAKTMLDCC